MNPPTDDTDVTAGDERDDELLALLGRALAADDPVPDQVVAGARMAFTWRTIDAELAELVFDSAVESAGVRSDDTARQVTFQSPGIEIEVTVIDEVARRVVGQLVPPRELDVELTRAADTSPEVGPMRARADRLGRFTFDGVPAGPIRLAVHGDDGRMLVRTDWVQL